MSNDTFDNPPAQSDQGYTPDQINIPLTLKRSDLSLYKTLQAAQPRNPDTTDRTEALVAAAKDAGLISDPVTLGLDIVSFQTSTPDNPLEIEGEYIILSAGNTDTPINLSVVPLTDNTEQNGTSAASHTHLATVVEDLLDHVQDIINVRTVITDQTSCTPTVLSAIDDRDITYVARKSTLAKEWEVTDDPMLNKEPVTAVRSNTVNAPTHQGTHETVEILQPLTPDTPTDNKDDHPTRYLVIVTNQDIDLTEIADLSKEIFTQWLAVEIQAGTLREISTLPPIGNALPTDAPLQVTTAIYNYWQLVRVTAASEDENVAPVTLYDARQLLDAHMMEEQSRQ